MEKILYHPEELQADHQRFGFEMTYPVGYTILRTEDQVRKRPLILDIWYPAQAPASRSILKQLPGKMPPPSKIARPALA